MTTTYDNLQVDIGNAPNDDQGDPLRTAFDKINQRFAELRIFANGRGDWAPSTVYTANPNRDWVIFEGEGYLATSNHTSGATFAADLAAGKWVEADAIQLRADLGQPDGAKHVGGVDLQLADYTALRAYAGTKTRVYITGALGTAKPAGIAGVFQHDPSDTTSADNGGTVIVGADGRRWKRDFSGDVDQGWFASLQAAINASGGKTLRVRGAEIASVDIPHSMILRGDGDATILRQAAASNRFFIQLTENNVSVVFRDMLLDQNNAGQTLGSGKFLFNADRPGSNVLFENVTFKDFCEGAIRIRGDQQSSTREALKAQGCRFRGGTESDTGILTYTVFGFDECEVEILDCDFDHGLALTKGGLNAIMVSTSAGNSTKYSKLVVNNCTFRGYGRTLSGNGVGVVEFYAILDSVQVTNNKFLRSCASAIRGKTNSRRIIISGNEISESQVLSDATVNNGISIFPGTVGSEGSDLIIEKNIVDGSPRRGIVVEGDASIKFPNVSITGNIVKNTGDRGISLKNCRDFQISENIITSTSETGIGFETCEGVASISKNIIDGSGAQGIQGFGTQTNLHISVADNVIDSATIAGVFIENVGTLTLTENLVRNVIDGGGAGQRAFRIGGSTGTATAVVRNNTALGTFASGVFNVSGVGVANIFESGNTWNYQGRYLSAAPTTGTWERGSIVWNTAPAASGNIGWVCVTAGTPGTWKTWGAIAA